MGETQEQKIKVALKTYKSLCKKCNVDLSKDRYIKRDSHGRGFLALLQTQHGHVQAELLPHLVAEDGKSFSDYGNMAIEIKYLMSWLLTYYQDEESQLSLHQDEGPIGENYFSRCFALLYAIYWHMRDDFVMRMIIEWHLRSLTEYKLWEDRKAMTLEKHADFDPSLHRFIYITEEAIRHVHVRYHLARERPNFASAPSALPKFREDIMAPAYKPGGKEVNAIRKKLLSGWPKDDDESLLS